MPSPIHFTCSILGSHWERRVWAQSPGPAARVFLDDVRAADVPVHDWAVVRLTWIVPSGRSKGRLREAHYLWHGRGQPYPGTINPYYPRGNDAAYQDAPLPEPKEPA